MPPTDWIVKDPRQGSLILADTCDVTQSDVINGENFLSQAKKFKSSPADDGSCNNPVQAALGFMIYFPYSWTSG